MAVQAGIGFSRIILLVGGGYSGTVLLQNRKLSDILGDLQSLVAGYEKNGVSDVSDAIATQVHRLAMEIKQLASARQITVVNGNSGGLSFSDLMYVTKKNIASAVSNLTKHLENVSSTLAATKKHLTQRIENLDGKLDDQIEVSKLIKNEVTGVRAELSDIGYDLDIIHEMVSGMNGKIMSLEEKQNFANRGIFYLVDFVNGKGGSSPQLLQMPEQQLSGQTQGLLPSSEAPTLKGLKDIADSLLGDVNRPASDGKVKNLADRPRRLMRHFGRIMHTARIDLSTLS